MKKAVTFIALLLFVAVGVFADPGENMSGKYYDITITNATRGQVVTPPVVITHDSGFQLFELGSEVLPELAALAEDGMTAPLTGYLDMQPDVLDYAVGGGVILPGESMTLQFRVKGSFRYVTVVGMLASTNDAFFAVRGLRVSGKNVGPVEADAYDAGSEANSEDCAYIPGPPCGNGGSHDPAEAEGYVHVHAGIHGIGDLDPAAHDWRNPVVEIAIQPIQ